MHVQAYLSFDGRCEEAAGFYVRALGAEIEDFMRYRDSPEPCDPAMVSPGSENKVMHMSLRIGDTVVMASDGSCKGAPAAQRFQGFSLALTAKDVAEADRLFTALGEDGQIQMPIGPTFFSPRFGVVTDRYGVSWMVLVAA